MSAHRGRAPPAHFVCAHHSAHGRRASGERDFSANFTTTVSHHLATARRQLPPAQECLRAWTCSPKCAAMPTLETPASTRRARASASRTRRRSWPRRPGLVLGGRGEQILYSARRAGGGGRGSVRLWTVCSTARESRIVAKCQWRKIGQQKTKTTGVVSGLSHVRVCVSPRIDSRDWEAPLPHRDTQFTIHGCAYGGAADDSDSYDDAHSRLVRRQRDDRRQFYGTEEPWSLCPRPAALPLPPSPHPSSHGRAERRGRGRPPTAS